MSPLPNKEKHHAPIIFIVNGFGFTFKAHVDSADFNLRSSTNVLRILEPARIFFMTNSREVVKNEYSKRYKEKAKHSIRRSQHPASPRNNPRFSNLPNFRGSFSIQVDREFSYYGGANIHCGRSNKLAKRPHWPNLR